MINLSILASLAMVTSALSQSAKTEIEIPEPFECSTLAYLDLREFDKRNTPREKLRAGLVLCRIGKLSCGFDQEKGNVSCVSTAGLFK